MKLVKLCLAASMVAASFMLTSCLNGNNTTSGVAYGVVHYSMDAFHNVVAVDDNGTDVFAPEFETCQDGDCVGFVYKIDYDKQQSNKYVTASVSDYVVCDKYMAQSVVDTTSASILPSEKPIENVYSLQYVKGYLFANVAFKNIPEDQKNTFSISYNTNEAPDKNENGNVYKLYVRSNVVKEGEKTPRDGVMMNAFFIKSYIDYIIHLEKSNGKQFVQFKYKFIDSLDKDKTFATWKDSEVSILPIPQDNNKPRSFKF